MNNCNPPTHFNDLIAHSAGRRSSPNEHRMRHLEPVHLLRLRGSAVWEAQRPLLLRLTSTEACSGIVIIIFLGENISSCVSSWAIRYETIFGWWVGAIIQLQWVLGWCHVVHPVAFHRFPLHVVFHTNLCSLGSVVEWGQGTQHPLWWRCWDQNIFLVWSV